MFYEESRELRATEANARLTDLYLPQIESALLH